MGVNLLHALEDGVIRAKTLNLRKERGERLLVTHILCQVSNASNVALWSLHFSRQAREAHILAPIFQHVPMLKDDPCPRLELATTQEAHVIAKEGIVDKHTTKHFEAATSGNLQWHHFMTEKKNLPRNKMKVDLSSGFKQSGDAMADLESSFRLSRQLSIGAAAASGLVALFSLVLAANALRRLEFAGKQARAGILIIMALLAGGILAVLVYGTESTERIQKAATATKEGLRKVEREMERVDRLMAESVSQLQGVVGSSSGTASNEAAELINRIQMLEGQRAQLKMQERTLAAQFEEERQKLHACQAQLEELDSTSA